MGESVRHSSQSLLDGGHSVAIIDRNRAAFNRLGGDDRATRIEGIGFDRDRLIEAGIEQARACRRHERRQLQRARRPCRSPRPSASSTWSPASTTRAEQRSTSASAWRRWPPSPGRPTRCCAA
ncbi:MAG: hypothetical protein WKF58_16520 [Ilumatobacteraceae bacterium]